ncbi:nucleotide exchange factor GrpE [Buchnera aphidicola]|uniref:Protein GrpE n=1 Tax=Buchnera aphidicola (Cinara cf. splendens/pseudotsugae 3390) TaxID=2518980 RepID=A0A451CXN8_9GAMM|nr:nucleotide exchange factor GrpE [Buchnera aphidicola]VFP77737.1 Protein GrpE [Buchnera aphidicola (Cinara cf. splendens/pseudotsugae 3390)]
MNKNDFLQNKSEKEKKSTLEFYKKSLEKKKLKLSTLKKDLLKISNNYSEKFLQIEKRLQKKVNNTYYFSLEKNILSMLPVIDSIDSTENVLNNFNYENSDIYIFLKKIQKNFSSFFLKYNISVINSINIPFDPNLHQAISIDFSKKYNNNYISNIIQKGYLLRNRLLRPALVSVSKIK